MKRLLVALTAAVLFSTLLNSCQFKTAKIKSYKVALRLVPKVLDPWKNQVNTNQLIMLQLYIPFFEIFGRNQLKSRILDESKSKATDSTSKQYKMCLKPNLKFFTGKAVELEDFISSIKKAHDELSPLQKIVSITGENLCVNIELEDSDPDYFRKLTSVSTSLFQKDSLHKDIPIGVGPYRVKFSTNDRLVLDANGFFPSSIQRVEFIKFEDSWDEDELAKIDDLNHVYQLKIPPGRKINFKRVQRPSLKSYILFFGNYSEKNRSFIYSCLSRLPLGEVYGLNLQNVPGLLPEELLGYNVNSPSPHNCEDFESHGFSKKPEFELIHFDEKKVKELAFFFHTKTTDLPFNINVKYIPFEKTPELVLSHKPVITLIGIDSTGSFSPLLDGSSSFFRSFYGENRLSKNKNEKVKTLIDSAISEKRIDRKASFYKKAHQSLLKEKYFISLGQDVLTQYYSPKVNEISWADPFSPFPLFSEFKLK